MIGYIMDLIRYFWYFITIYLLLTLYAFVNLSAILKTNIKQNKNIVGDYILWLSFFLAFIVFYILKKLNLQIF